jgi:hypothetical protein
MQAALTHVRQSASGGRHQLRPPPATKAATSTAPTSSPCLVRRRHDVGADPDDERCPNRTRLSGKVLRVGRSAGLAFSGIGRLSY